MATKKIIIKAPTKREVHDASGQTKKGHSSGGRVLNEAKAVKKSDRSKK